MGKREKLRMYFFLVAVISCAIWGTVVAINYISFQQSCAGELKAAMESQRNSDALQHLTVALAWMEGRGLRFADPDSTTGLWYHRLTIIHDASYQNFGMLGDGAVGKAVGDFVRDEDGNVLSPHGISVYPHEWQVGVWGFVSFLCALFGWIFYPTKSDEEEDDVCCPQCGCPLWATDEKK